jgi:hypothetical protein
VTNTGATPLTGVYIRLRDRYEPLKTRAEVQRWAAGDAAFTTDIIEPLPRSDRRTDRQNLRTLPPRRATPVTLTVPEADFGFTQVAAAFGARGIAVEVYAIVEVNGPPTRVGVAYSFMVWDPVPAQQPTRVTLLVPITSTQPQTDASEPTSALVDAMAPSGRLGRLAQVVRQTPISWAIDPALLDAATRAQLPGAVTTTSSGSGPGTAASATSGGTTPGGASSTSTPRSSSGIASGTGQDPTPVSPADVSASWLATLKQTAATNPPLVLPFGDPDLPSLAHTPGGDRLLSLARSQADAITKQAFGAGPQSSIAWPAEGRADLDTAKMLAASAWRGIVLTAGSQPPAPALPYTPTGRSDVARGDGSPLAGLLYDEGLSALLARLGMHGLAAPQVTLLQQRLLAELATITAERPDLPRHLLITAPRSWDPDPGVVEQVVQTLNDVPWAQLQSSDALLAERPTPGLAATPNYPRRLRAAELTKSVTWAADHERQLAAFAPALTQPQLVLPDLQRRIISLVGSVWRGRTSDEIVRARAPVQNRLNGLFGAITVVPGSTLNLLSHTAKIPVTVSNQLNQPVRVELVLRSRSALLLIWRTNPLTVGAHGTRNVTVPVKALGNLVTEVDASVWTVPRGAGPISPAVAPLEVRVHSDWETIGLSAVGGLLGLLLVVGLFRSIRRGRRPLPPEIAPDPDEVLARQESGRRLPAALHRLRDLIRPAENSAPGTHREGAQGDAGPSEPPVPDRSARRRP